MKKFISNILSLFIFSLSFAQNHNTNLIVGTYTNTCKSNGIYVFDFDSINAKFKLKNQSEKVISPSFLSLSADKKNLYAVNENGKNSTVSSFTFDSKTGKLIQTSLQNAMGADACHLINDEKNVIIANYSGGNIAVFKKNKTGILSNASQVLNFYGHSIDKRQASPHLHQVQFSPDKKFVLAADLGTDKIYIFDYKKESSSQILTLKDSVSVKKGSGPRHLTISKNGKFVYLLQELDGSLSVFGFENGILSKIQDNNINDQNFGGDISAAEIEIAPSGKYLYATNRGTANEISCYEIQENGLLKFSSRTSTLGNGPRSFAIDPSGNYLLIAHQYSNDVIIFKIDKTTGDLIDTKNKIEICSPVCLLFTK
jgi:6-phosphogluconolactonase